MGREAHLRRLTRLARRQQPMRLVPSRRGLATVFVATAAAGTGIGLLLGHFFHG